MVFLPIYDRGELALPTLEVGHELLVVLLHLVDVDVAVAPVSAQLVVLALVQPREFGVRGVHKVVESVQVGDAFVGEDEELVIGLLEDGHAFAVDFELFAVETDLGLAAFFDVA